MLYSFLLIVLIIDAIVLIAAILLQAGKGSGLAANFGGASSSPDAFIGIRQAGNLLTTTTWWGAGIARLVPPGIAVSSRRCSADAAQAGRDRTCGPRTDHALDCRERAGAPRARSGAGSCPSRTRTTTIFRRGQEDV